MKQICFLFAFILSIIVCTGQTADSSYALLRIYRGSGSGKDSVKVKVYNQEPFNVAPNTVVNFKIYSAGGFVISATNGLKINGYDGWYSFNSNYKGPSWYKTFELGKTYCMIADPFGGENMLTDIKEKAFNQRIANKNLNVVDLEEDLNKPIKRGAEVTPSGGTGFLISSQGYIVTNSHVISNSKKITVRGVEGDLNKKYPAKLVADDKTNDIAVLQIDLSGLKIDTLPYSIRSLGVETGEEIFVLGYPLKKIMGEEVKLTDGIVSSKSGYQGSSSTYQVSAGVQPGNSGSPLFDKKGNLIGIINGKLEHTESVNYAVKITYLKALLETSDIPSDLNKSPSTNPVSLVEVAKKYSRYIYIIENEK
jgi:S1-C subfamily serine protease